MPGCFGVSSKQQDTLLGSRIIRRNQQELSDDRDNSVIAPSASEGNSRRRSRNYDERVQRFNRESRDSRSIIRSGSVARPSNADNFKSASRLSLTERKDSKWNPYLASDDDRSDSSVPLPRKPAEESDSSEPTGPVAPILTIDEGLPVVVRADVVFEDFLLWKAAGARRSPSHSAAGTSSDLPASASLSDELPDTHTSSEESLCHADQGSSAREFQSVGIKEAAQQGKLRPLLIAARTAMTLLKTREFRPEPNKLVERGADAVNVAVSFERQRTQRTVIENSKITRTAKTSTQKRILTLLVLRGVVLSPQGLRPTGPKSPKSEVKLETGGFVPIEKMSDLEAAVRMAFPPGMSEAAIYQWARHAEMFCGPKAELDSRGSLASRFDKWLTIVRAINPLVASTAH